MKIIFLTGNKDKFSEAVEIIPYLQQSDIDLTEIQSIDPKDVILHKLEEAKKHIKGNLIVEDTSLTLEGMNGLPGTLIKLFLKTIKNEGLVKIAKSFGNDKATAKVMIGYADEKGECKFFEGLIEGRIVKPRGDNGFGWDEIFEPQGMKKTFAEMTTEEKNKISMRKLAFQKLKDAIEG
ncbi:TPA: non-canonical purine NTP pyrophosphatase, RdgB/HAM1 family [Candidatus Shapirobacteria bacterium]|nr:non-canonical purine NTP pyrophosphatase, RdgB/HAM1 family [Candidatus Shapirobacteria bacterium]